jgi:hypothetical protein
MLVECVDMESFDTEDGYINRYIKMDVSPLK